MDINGLDGRVLKAPATGKNPSEILLIYGHHAMLERWWGLVENLQTYGNVTMPDLPGFGGMDSFATIGKKPSIDNYADYLAAFIKLRYKGKKIKIVAISFGFIAVTRMLQRYPELTKKVDLIVSMVGFMHRDDFVYSVLQRRFFRLITRFFGTRVISTVIHYCFMNGFVIKNLAAVLPNSKKRMIEVGKEEFNRVMDFDVKIWQANDVRTHWLTTCEFLNIDNCRVGVDLPIYHVASEADHYFHNEIVKQHMLVVFNDYKHYVAISKAHTPHVLADKKAMGTLLPPGLRRVLRKK